MNYKRPGFEIEAGHGGAIAMLLVPEDIAQEITEWGKSQINDDEIYGQDGKGRDGSPHVTLQNGMMVEDTNELERLFSDLPGMQAELGPIGVFRNDKKDYDVVHITVKCDDLHAVNAMTSDLLEVNNPQGHEFNPHITLAYVKKGAGKRFDGLQDFVGKKVDLSKLAIDGKGVEPRMLDLKPRVDHLEGGLADAMDYDDFDPKALKKGADHELEHTKNIEIAREIAMDHLAEDPSYYDKLEKVEGKKAKCNHSKKGWCGRCKLGEPLKDSIDYGSRHAAEDVEEYLLDSGKSIRGMSSSQIKKVLMELRKEL